MTTIYDVIGDNKKVVFSGSHADCWQYMKDVCGFYSFLDRKVGSGGMSLPTISNDNGGE